MSIQLQVQKELSEIRIQFEGEKRTLFEYLEKRLILNSKYFKLHSWSRAIISCEMSRKTYSKSIQISPKTSSFKVQVLEYTIVIYNLKSLHQ